MNIPGLRKLDYLSFTLKDCTAPEGVMESLGVGFVPVPYGRFGYRKMAVCDEGGLSVMWDGAVENMGVHVQISGRGCDLTERQQPFTSWREWIGAWFAKGARVSRIDLAIDDVSGGIEFETVYDQIETHTAMMRTKSGGYHLKWDPHHRYRTVYVGRRESETLMRCYDKGLQLGGDKSWLRFEFEYKKARANGVAELLVAEGWDAAIGVARSFIEFKDPEHKTTDKTRQRPAEWWVKLLNASKHVIRLPGRGETSLTRAYGWLRRQGAPVLATLIEHEGGDLSWLVELAKEGKSRWKGRHHRMLAEGT